MCININYLDACETLLSATLRAQRGPGSLVFSGFRVKDEGGLRETQTGKSKGTKVIIKSGSAIYPIETRYARPCLGESISLLLL